MKKLTLFISILLVVQLANAQITFQKTIGGTGADAAYDMEPTTDGGFIISGYMGGGATMQDACLIKIDSNGDTLWTKSYGGTANEYFRAVKQTNDGGYIATGSSNSFGSFDYNLYLVKTDSTGNLLWSKTYNGNTEEIGGGVIQTNDGGYVITGNYNLAFLYLIRTDSIGDTLWTRTLNGAVGYSVLQTPDDGFIVSGQILSAGTEQNDVYLVRTNNNGDTLWTKNYGGTGGEQGRLIKPTADGGYLIAGSATSFGAGSNDAYLLKTDSAGQLLWSRTYGGTGNETANSIEPTNDGGYIMAGNTSSFGAGLLDAYLIKIDSTGTVQWSKAYGSASNETGFHAWQTNDGGYIVTGSAQNLGAGMGDIYLFKTDSAGNSGCNESAAATISTTPATQTAAFSKPLNYGGTIAAPVSVVSGGATITMLCAALGIQSATSDALSAVSVFPDPSLGNFTIAFKGLIERGEIDIYNLLGEKVVAQTVFNESKKEINLKNILLGIYFVKIFDGEKNYCKKIIIE